MVLVVVVVVVVVVVCSIGLWWWFVVMDFDVRWWLFVAVNEVVYYCGGLWLRFMVMVVCGGGGDHLWFV